MLKNIVYAFICLTVVLLSAEASAKIKTKKLLISTQVDSWVEQKEITRKFSAQGLFEIINGGAEEYIGEGLLEGIHQQFANKAGKTVEVFVEDFGVAEKSLAMLNLKKQGYSEATPIATLPGVQCFASKAIGALVVIASVEHVYVEMTVSGFPDDSESEKVAATFIGYYQQRMK